MIKARPQYAGQFDIVQIQDFENPGGLTEAVKGVDGIIHTASVSRPANRRLDQKLTVLSYTIAIDRQLKAASTNPSIRRIVITSSFASVVDINRKGPPYFTHTGKDWNPLTYEEAADPATTAVVAYRGSKKFAELEAWNYVKNNKPSFDLVALCPPMTFGPVVHSVANVDQLNKTDSMLWSVAAGKSPLPTVHVPFWIDVRDLAIAHVEALLREEAGGKRYIPASPHEFSYSQAADIIAASFSSLKEVVSKERQAIEDNHGVDGETAAKELEYGYHSFEDTVKDFVTRALGISK
ncbi:hypothetical protein N7468_009422 [Penicillium chermesinum]|uniref:3-beta hydroxysteroid dehydrogenase/isomerase domain-containing protein n=1 Tax=Penicillium chermesinum TaxID=63820 RepID=A0A9W9TEZ6_9EURO|nr:uncharacterized protein N7468_009422 [Penicillium chermesinum]KAJ5220218.1 hypothetical protein N7468_009422 [Penicillium chermesinum]KAJ6157662.1 hypothetical protein N7470_005254 [Penicillium chermesinum]